MSTHKVDVSKKDLCFKRIMKNIMQLRKMGISSTHLQKQLRLLIKQVDDPLYGKEDGRKQVLPVRYSDGVNEWSGRGKVPNWLKEKIDKGFDKELFRL